MSLTFFRSVTGAAGHISDTNAYASAFAVEYRLTHSTAHTVSAADVESNAAGGMVGLLLPLSNQRYSERYVYVRLKDFPEAQDNMQDVAGFGSGFGNHGNSANEIIVTIADGGTYSIPPTVVFSAPDQTCVSTSQIEAAVLMDGSAVAAIQILSGGAGYTSTPTYSFLRNPEDTETDDAVPVQLTPSDMFPTYLDKQDRGTYMRIRLPSEYAVPEPDNVVPLISEGAYGMPPVAVQFSLPDLPNGQRAEGELVFDEAFNLTGVRITYPGRGYLSVPTITVVRAVGDTETDDAVFEPLQITQAEYLVYTHTFFDRADNGVSGSPVYGLVETSGTLHTTWLSWPSVRQAMEYEVYRDGNVIGNAGDVRQMPFEDVYVQTGSPELHSYSILARYSHSIEPTGNGVRVLFSGEGNRIDGSPAPTLSYVVRAVTARIAEADEQNHLNPYGTARIGNSRIGSQTILSGSSSPVLHAFRDPADFQNLLQDYQVEYEQWTYMPAAYAGTERRLLSFYLQTSPDELKLYRTSALTQVETPVNVTVTPPSRSELPIWLTLEDEAAVGGDTHRLEFKFENSVVRQFGWDGKWYMMWPSVSGTDTYHLSYLDNTTEVPIAQIRGTMVYRDSVEITPTVTEIGQGSSTPRNEINWSTIKFATGFEVQRRTLNGADEWQTLVFLTDQDAKLARNGNHPTSYLDWNVLPGERYEYRILAGRNPDGYVVRASIGPGAVSRRVTDVQVMWSAHPGARWQLQRRLTTKVLESVGTVSSSTAKTEYGADGDDDGFVSGDALHVVGTLPDLREKSEWVDVTDEDQLGTPPYFDSVDGSAAVYDLVEKLEYRVIIRIPLHNIVPGTIRTGWSSGSTVGLVPVEGADKYSVYARLKVQDDPYFQWLEPEPGNSEADSWIRYYSGELFSRPGQRRGYTRLYPVSTNIVPYASKPETVVDTKDHSVPSEITHSVEVGPMVANSGGVAPQAKMILSPVITSAVYTLSWPIPGEPYTIWYRTKFGDGEFGAWQESGEVTYNPGTLNVTDLSTRVTEYSVRYRIKGAAKSQDTVTV